MSGTFSNFIKRKFSTAAPPLTPLSAAVAEAESITLRMRDLARKINSTHTIQSCICLSIGDMVCPVRPAKMSWTCYSHLPIPGTEFTPSYREIHSINDLRKRENMFGFRTEELALIERYFEATQELNLLAEEASRHYLELLIER